jgi:hypothetical protein
MRKSKKSLKSFVKEEKNHSCYKSTKFFIPIQNDEKVFVIGYYEGSLTKRNGSTLLTSWKLRYFRLKGTTLYYYENDRSETPKGELTFHTLTKIMKSKDKDSAMPFMFAVTGYKEGNLRTLELLGDYKRRT